VTYIDTKGTQKGKQTKSKTKQDDTVLRVVVIHFNSILVYWGAKSTARWSITETAQTYEQKIKGKRWNTHRTETRKIKMVTTYILEQVLMQLKLI
jgi:type II secretory pathway component PulL